VGAISPSVFLTRDFIEYVLPTLVAVVLFSPLGTRSAGVSLEIMLSGAIVASYLLSAFAEDVAGTSWLRKAMATLHQRRRPGWRPKERPEPSLDEIRRTHRWWCENWDYDRLFYSLCKDDREYIYLTRAYLNCFLILSLYLLLYMAVNLLWLVGNAVIELAVVAGLSWDLLTLGTPVLGGWSAPTLLLTLIAYLLFDSIYSWHIGEAISLFDDGGIYPEFAAKHHRADGGLATAVWGRVHRGGEAIRGARVELFRDGEWLARTRTDIEGRFQFKQAVRSCVEHRCEVRVQRRGFPIEVVPTEIPELHIDLAEPALDTTEPRPLKSSFRLLAKLASGLLRLFARVYRRKPN
jgi:hypothetical protein